MEIVLQLCDQDDETAGSSDHLRTTVESNQQNPTSSSETSQQNAAIDAPNSTRWSLGDMRRKLSVAGKPIASGGRPPNGAKSFASGRVYLRIVTARMRCSIKAKEQFENMDNGAKMYIKTAVFEHDILSGAWKSDHFAPSLSVRWNPENCELRVPLKSLADLRHVTVRTTIATKTKLGKKIVLGTVMLGGTASAPTAVEQWTGVAEAGDSALSRWHAFE